MQQKTTKTVIRRKKFIPIEIPMTRSKIELIGSSPKELIGRTIKLDLTRQLKGKSVEMTIKVEVQNDKAVGIPFKIKLLSYFIRRMIRKRISYVEDSFSAPSQESMLKIKPFLITKRRVSKRIRKTLRNKEKNWIIDYVAEKKDSEIFNEIITNKMQKALSLYLKKTYPLSLCEIRVLELIRPLKKEEIPKIDKSKKLKKTEDRVDQLKEIEDDIIKSAEKEILETQEKALEIEKKLEKSEKKPTEEEKIEEIKEEEIEKLEEIKKEKPKKKLKKEKVKKLKTKEKTN